MWLIVVEWRTGVTTGCLAPDTMATLDFSFKLFMREFLNSGFQIFVSFSIFAILNVLSRRTYYQRTSEFPRFALKKLMPKLRANNKKYASILSYCLNILEIETGRIGNDPRGQNAQVFLSARRPIERVLLITSETNCGYLVLLSTRKKVGRDV